MSTDGIEKSPLWEDKQIPPEAMAKQNRAAQDHICTENSMTAEYVENSKI